MVVSLLIVALGKLELEVGVNIQPRGEEEVRRPLEQVLPAVVPYYCVKWWWWLNVTVTARRGSS